MATKINAISMLVIMITIFSIIYYEIVIDIASRQKGTLLELDQIKNDLQKASVEQEILDLVSKSDELYNQIKLDVDDLYSAFTIIKILSFVNTTFFLQSIVTFLYTKRLNRYILFPTLHHVTDCILFGCSCLFIHWFMSNIQDGINVEGLSNEEK